MTILTFDPPEDACPLTLCPRCGGEGSGVEDHHDTVWGSSSEHWTCPACGGDGYVEDDGDLLWEGVEQ